MQLDLLLGSVERPIPTDAKLLKAMRNWWMFESKQAAISWSTRHAPEIPEGVTSVSAHPRARQTNLGWALIYDAVQRIPMKLVLTRGGGLTTR